MNETTKTGLTKGETIVHRGERILGLLNDIEMLTRGHMDSTTTNEATWGKAGDLGYIEHRLQEIVDDFGGK